jgi:hypothetical protein
MDLPYRSYAPRGLLQQRGATALQKPMGAGVKTFYQGIIHKRFL